MIKTDILIIGGGIAGCISGIALAQDYDVTIIDKNLEPINRIGESLAPAAKRILKKLGLLTDDALIKTIVSNNLGMQSYWGSEQVQVSDHLSNPDGAPKSLDRKKFELYLRQGAKEKFVRCLWGLKFLSSVFEDDLWTIMTIQGSSKQNVKQAIRAKFVIDATGRQAHFARSLGMKRLHFDKLISCWISLQNTSTNTMSTIMSEEMGWWYSAVLPNNLRILAYQTDADLVNKTSLKQKDAFLELVAKNKILAPLVLHQEINCEFHGVVSANSTRLDQAVGHRWIALGDAAISFDPLSSQGMYNAMATAMQAADLFKTYKLITLNDDKTKIEFQSHYTYQINRIWEHYIRHKNAYYNLERRWATSPFWQRRHSIIKSS